MGVGVQGIGPLFWALAARPVKAGLIAIVIDKFIPALGFLGRSTQTTFEGVEVCGYSPSSSSALTTEGPASKTCPAKAMTRSAASVITCSFQPGSLAVMG